METDATQPLEPFTPAHASYLDQLSDSEFWSHAVEMANSLPAITHNRNSEDSANDYLLCELAQGCCLLPLASLYEVIVAPAHFTYLPVTPSWMLGLMAWRDEAIAVVDLAAYLLSPSSQLPLSPTASPQPLFENTRIVIVSYETVFLGLQVSLIDRGTALPFVNEEITLATLERVQYHEVIADMYQGALILNMEALLAHIARHLGILSSHE